MSTFQPEQGPLVRPYAVTGGRTRPDYELAIEALVSTTRLGDRSAESTAPERQQICDLCRRARSVAEIAAYLRMPLDRRYWPATQHFAAPKCGVI